MTIVTSHRLRHGLVRPVAAVSLLLVAVLLAASCGGGNYGGGGGGGGYGQGPGGPGGKAVVSSASEGGLGAILVDDRGRTLYLFEKDPKGKSSCSGGCAQAWPPLTTSGSPRPGQDVKGALLDTTSRTGGEKQVTYNGHPLYFYQGDSKAGQTTGQELDQFGAEWYVLSPSGEKVTGQGSSY
ncbi:MAG: COG4315 family predicted lipoprotein [Carbonactinosporaceae bacterium]